MMDDQFPASSVPHGSRFGLKGVFNALTIKDLIIQNPSQVELKPEIVTVVTEHPLHD